MTNTSFVSNEVGTLKKPKIYFRYLVYMMGYENHYHSFGRKKQSNLTAYLVDTCMGRTDCSIFFYGWVCAGGTWPGVGVGTGGVTGGSVVTSPGPSVITRSLGWLAADPFRGGVPSALVFTG